MSSRVLVLPELGDTWVVACFHDDCPDHGVGALVAPWVDEFGTKAEADAEARRHRKTIRAAQQAGRCAACGQSLPRTEESR